MKLSLKLIVGISSLAVITTAGVFATTSCSKANPFEKYNVGDDITIKSKGDANKLKDVAKERIYGDSIEINRGNNPTNYSSLAKQSTFAIWAANATGNTPTESLASGAIYWELAKTIAENYLSYKHEVSLKFSDPRSIFIDQLTNPVGSSDGTASTNIGTSITYYTSKKNKRTFNASSPIIFSYPTDGNTLPLNLQIYQADDDQTWSTTSFMFTSCHWLSS